MRNNVPVTDRETLVPEAVELISSTDSHGTILDCNDAFVAMSGFDRSELIGQSHNIVRHPDMPEAAFADMWANLEAGRPWMGLVKNRRKDGGFYWVDAYVTPIVENGRIRGYESVRVRPERELVEHAERVYARLRKGGSVPSRLPINLNLQMAASNAGLLTLGALLWWFGFDQSMAAGAIIVGLLLVASWVVSNYLTRGFCKAARAALDTVDNPLLQYLYTNDMSEAGQLVLGQRMQRARLRTVLGRIHHSAHELSARAQTASDIAIDAHNGIQTQMGHTDQAATAMEEMSQSVAEVARHATHASEHATSADQDARHSRQVVDTASAAMNALADQVGRATEVINALEKESEGIDSVLTVIQSIAEQTNLLALNAAIEAARAGDQGRGFAVVADEVRTLASRTGESTQEIQAMIEGLQQRAREAVRVMQAGQAEVGRGVEQTDRVHRSLIGIADAVQGISDMNASIASAAEEQSLVSREISGNIHQINNLGAGAARSAEQATAESDRLRELAATLESLVVRFRD